MEDSQATRFTKTGSPRPLDPRLDDARRFRRKCGWRSGPVPSSTEVHGSDANGEWDLVLDSEISGCCVAGA